MTKSDTLEIIPVYKGMNKIFDGFAVYRNNKLVKQDEKPVILRLKTNKEDYQCKNGCFLSKKEIDNGVYEKSSSDSLGYLVKYDSKFWELSFKDYDRLSQPSLIFTAKSEKGSFKGYSITQFDENTKKIENRGSISPENVVYKRCSDGKYACIYNDEQAGGEVIPYHMENISKEEYESRLKNDSKKTRVQRRNR